jgi:hypothetical protein
MFDAPSRRLRSLWPIAWTFSKPLGTEKTFGRTKRFTVLRVTTFAFAL